MNDKLLKVCENERVVDVGWGGLKVKCQVGIHRGGHCRAVIDKDVVIMFPRKSE